MVSLTQEDKYLCPQKDWYKNVGKSFTHHSPGWAPPNSTGQLTHYMVGED